MRRRIRRLSSLILLAQVAILSASLLIGFVLFAVTARANLTSDYQDRAADIAQTFAEMPTVQRCLSSGPSSCDGDVQQLATATEQRTGAAYVVVIDMDTLEVVGDVPDVIPRT